MINTAIKFQCLYILHTGFLPNDISPATLITFFCSWLLNIIFQFFLAEEDELVSELSALPLRMDTFRIRSQKQELENKIAEIDEAKKIFNRPKVFVKVDS